MKKVFNRIIAVFLTLSLLIGVTPIIAAASNSGNDTEQDISVSGTDSFSNIVMTAVETNGTVNEAGYGISLIEMSEKTAKVSLSAPDNTTLVIAIYTEDGQMVGSSVKDVNSESNEYYVDIDIETMPEYYVVKGFMLDSNLCAVCKTYVCNDYTKAMQEFLSKTEDDFETDLVISFDDENFAVLNDSVIRVTSTETTDILQSADQENDIYVIANASDVIKNLNPGDTFCLTYSEDGSNYVIVTVSDISVRGDTVTINSSKETVEDSFSYIKFEASGGLDENEAQNVELGSAYEEEETLDTASVEVDADKKLSYPIKTGIAYKDDDVSVKGSLSVTFTVEMKVYYDAKLFGKDYFEYRFEHKEEMTGSFEIKGKLAGLDKDKVKISTPKLMMGPFSIKASIYPIFEFNVNIKFQVKVTNLFVQTYNPKDGENQVQEKSKDFSGEIKEKFELKVGIGVDITIKAEAILLALTTSAEAGIKLTGDVDGSIKCALDKYHYCDLCVGGDVNFFLKIGMDISIEITKKLKWTFLDISAENEVKLCKFYASTLNDAVKFGFSECPNKLFGVTFYVTEFKDTDGDGYSDKSLPLANVALTLKSGKFDSNQDGKLDNETAKTGSDGKVKIYFEKGKSTVSLALDGYETTTKTVNVTETMSKVCNITMVKKDTSTNDEQEKDTDNDNESYWYDGLPETDEKYFTYTVSNEQATITGYTGTDATIIIPTTLGGYEVVAIGSSAFENTKTLQRIKIADKITAIGSSAFSECTRLETIVLSKVETIGRYAFSGCTSLETIDLSKVETIGGYAFSGCTSLASIDISSVQTLGYAIIYGCELIKTITIPKTLKSCDQNGSFYGSSIKSATIESGIGKIPEYLFRSCSTLKSVTIPEYEDADITGYTIGDYAFSKTSLTKVDLPNSLTTIGEGAFYGCGYLESVSIKSNVKSIGSSAFSECTRLSDVSYSGTAEQWQNITIGNNNTPLTNIMGVSTAGENSYDVVPEDEEPLNAKAFSYSGAVAENEYIFIYLSNIESDLKISSETIKYIDCFIANADGTVSLEYVPIDNFENGRLLLSGDFGQGNELKFLNPEITFDPAGGDVDLASKIIDVGDCYGALPVPTRDGYTFAGWYDTKNNSITADTVCSVEKNQTLTARWTKNNIATNFIFGISLSNLISPDTNPSFDSIKITYSNYQNVVGTGTVIDTVDTDGNVTNSYTAVIYGDVSGDGNADGMDAVLIRCLYSGMLTEDDVGAANYEAANCNHDNNFDEEDIVMANRSGLYLTSISQENA